ncbi:MAG: ribonuclease P protein component [Atopobiaceae bacterium]|nr:ribonuclease P protein component [Atopobiaceae bacterium]
METIKSRREFEQVFSAGRRYGSPLVRLCVFRDPSAKGRVAFVAAKRLGNAVFRNRCKRVLREAARACELPCAGADVIMFATRATHDAHPASVAVDLDRLLTKARVR